MDFSEESGSMGALVLRRGADGGVRGAGKEHQRGGFCNWRASTRERRAQVGEKAVRTAEPVKERRTASLSYAPAEGEARRSSPLRRSRDSLVPDLVVKPSRRMWTPAATCAKIARLRSPRRGARAMSQIVAAPRAKTVVKTERPRLHKVILFNDDYTPREFVVTVLKAEFHLGEPQAQSVMLTAHRRGVCVVAVFARDIAETKAARATEAGAAKGYPLRFDTEPEE
jgi:ATP-dependent Clp protease adaptor protein ClpS